MDLSYLVNQIKAEPSMLKLRQGKVVTVNSDRTIDVQIAGDTNTLPSVRYLSNYAPKPDDQVWLLNDRTDLLAIGMIAGNERTLAPTVYRTDSLSIPINTETTITYQGERNNGWDCWSAANPTRLTAPITGMYQATSAIYADSQSNVDVSVGIKKNGSILLVRQDVTTKNDPNGFHGMVTTTAFPLTKGDYIETTVLHDYNPSINLKADANGYLNSMCFIYLGS